MNKRELSEELDKVLDAFKADAKAISNDPYSKEPAVMADIVELSRHTFYALNGFKNLLLQYLED